MNFNKIIISSIGLFLLLTSCDSDKKKYEDYNENNFYEVQGIITKITQTSNLFDSPRKKNIFYDYHLDLAKALIGSEDGIDLVLKIGDPIVVLVHKDDNTINFYGRYGIIDSRLKME